MLPTQRRDQLGFGDSHCCSSTQRDGAANKLGTELFFDTPECDRVEIFQRPRGQALVKSVVEPLVCGKDDKFIE